MTNLLPSYLMELKYYTTIYKNIHYIHSGAVIYFSVQVHSKNIHILQFGSKYIDSMESTIFIIGTIEKE